MTHSPVYPVVRALNKSIGKIFCTGILQRCFFHCFCRVLIFYVCFFVLGSYDVLVKLKMIPSSYIMCIHGFHLCLDKSHELVWRNMHMLYRTISVAMSYIVPFLVSFFLWQTLQIIISTLMTSCPPSYSLYNSIHCSCSSI